MTTRYHYQNTQKPQTTTLSEAQTAGHGDHWGILTDNISADVPEWLQQMIERAVICKGINPHASAADSRLLLAENANCHIKQVLAMKDSKPQRFINAFPCVNSPYGLHCRIERILANDDTSDALLRLRSDDGSIIYAFDQMYTANRHHYQQDTRYFVNFSAWAYEIRRSDEDEVIVVEDPEAIRYHRAFNDIVAANGGQVPNDIQEQINAWQPDTDEPLAPVEINMGQMCAYLFGDTLGQEDEAWCQGQVLGKQSEQFYGRDLLLFDVVILREPEAQPLVVRIAALQDACNTSIQVHDYVQVNLWLQAAIYQENQRD